MAFKEQLTEEQLKKVYEKYDFYMGELKEIERLDLY